MSELSPIFTVQVWLDGDDDPKYTIENVKDHLDGVMEKLYQYKEIKDYIVKVST